MAHKEDTLVYTSSLCFRGALSDQFVQLDLPWFCEMKREYTVDQKISLQWWHRVVFQPFNTDRGRTCTDVWMDIYRGQFVFVQNQIHVLPFSPQHRATLKLFTMCVCVCVCVIRSLHLLYCKVLCIAIVYILCDFSNVLYAFVLIFMIPDICDTDWY